MQSWVLIVRETGKYEWRIGDKIKVKEMEDLFSGLVGHEGTENPLIQGLGWT